MGLFDRAKKTMGGAGMPEDWAAKAQAAQQFAEEEFRRAGYGDGMPTMADMSNGLGAQMAADQQELQAYGAEIKRVYQIGEVGSGVIISSVDTGERTAGQAWFQIETSITLPGKDAYTAAKREMVPEMSLGQYAVGTTHEVRVDPADAQIFIFSS